MDARTVERLINIAPQIERFMQIEESEKKWLFLIVGKAEKRAIAILEAIENQYLTYEEIAKLTECNKNTVKQIVYALEKGGIPININSQEKFIYNTGRSRQLIKKGES